MPTTMTIWRRETSDTAPRGFGYPPTYHFDKPYTSGAEMIWAFQVEIELPDGYEVAENAMGEKCLFDADGKHMDIFDHFGHPALMLGLKTDANGMPVEVYKHIDVNPITRQRAAAGLTQQQLAEKMGVPQQHISRWECGERSPGQKSLKMLADALGCSVADLIE